MNFNKKINPGSMIFSGEINYVGNPITFYLAKSILPRVVKCGQIVSPADNRRSLELNLIKITFTIITYIFIISSKITFYIIMFDCKAMQ